MEKIPRFIQLRLGAPDFRDLPWDLPFDKWHIRTQRLVEVPRGLSRHPVVFLNYDGNVYALKSLAWQDAQKEYNYLETMEAMRLPAVTPVGYVQFPKDDTGILITSFLNGSLPYRFLFMQESFRQYREHLLDAIASLLVQLHLAGFYWGDCSLSNTLFRRDTGALRAYLVDIETGEHYPDQIPATKRYLDLEIMEENVSGDLTDLGASGLLAENIPVADTGAYIRLRYQRLWEEITKEEIIEPDEQYRIQERIRALNSIGFSVGDVELTRTDSGDRLRLKVMVTDRNFHRNQLYNLTGLDAEEYQARKMMNEIQEVKARLSNIQNRSTPLSVAAFHWLENIYKPVINELKPLDTIHTTSAELYCQVLEHKWYLSESAKQDVGHQFATRDFLRKFSQTEIN